jgi:hemolysin III
MVSEVDAQPIAQAPFLRPLLRGWLHLVAFFVLFACSPILFVRCATWAQVGWVLCFLFGVGAMLITSALLHRVNWTPSRRQAWRRADHSTIYLAITGTYFALAGLTMHGRIRMVVLIIIGISTVIGIIVRQFAMHAPKWANTIPYLAFSWAAASVMLQIYRGGGPLCFAFIVAGGLFYSVGAVFYGTKRPRLSPRVFGYHELFHAFTLVGVGFHFAAISVALR